MKLKADLILITVIVGLILSGCVGKENNPAPTTTPASTPSYTITEAINKNIVTATINGNGASSGDSIIMEITRLVPYTVEISFIKGTVLLSSDSNAQNMVVWKVSGKPVDNEMIEPVSEIVLDSSQPQSFILNAYCLDFYKENPGSNTKFYVGTLANPQIIRILNASEDFSSNIASIASIQIAIWVITEDVSKKDLIDKYPVEQKDIDNAKAILEEADIDTKSKRLFNN